MKRLLVNDQLSTLGEITFWHDLKDWFGCQPVTAPYDVLADAVEAVDAPTLIIRNASYFRPIKAECPQIALLQDIFDDGPMKKMQEAVSGSISAMVFNSRYTAYKYGAASEAPMVIPLPVDFSIFEPQNAMGCQQALSLPDGCVCWIGASQGAAGHVKGWDIFLSVVRQNPDIPFVAVLKDGAPEAVPPNLRYYVRLTHAELVRVIGACRVGLCTSRTESQHLAGIEMGACGLPMVAPPVGVYWQRTGPIINPLREGAEGLSDILKWSSAIRSSLGGLGNPDFIRDYWRKEFDKPVIKAQWTKLIEEVER